MSTTIAIVTDIHHGQDGFSKKASMALDIFPDFARFANDAKPDLVLDLGDRISDENEATDLRLEREVADAFKAVEAPIRHICGNHDVDFITPAQNTEIFGQEMVSEALDLGDWRLLIWRADAKNYKGLGFALPEHDLLWLATQIARADRPIAVFSHVPLSDHDVRATTFCFNVDLQDLTVGLAKHGDLGLEGESGLDQRTLDLHQLGLRHRSDRCE